MADLLTYPLTVARTRAWRARNRPATRTSRLDGRPHIATSKVSPTSTLPPLARTGQPWDIFTASDMLLALMIVYPETGLDPPPGLVLPSAAIIIDCPTGLPP